MRIPFSLRGDATNPRVWRRSYIKCSGELRVVDSMMTVRSCRYDE